MDRSKYQYEGMKWLVELELLNHPQVVNTLKLNIFMASKSIREAELLIYRENKAMLVLLDLTWFGKRFAKQRIFEEVQETLSQLLPSFRFRITDDPKIMNLAVEKVKQALTGGNYENLSNSNSSAIQRDSIKSSDDSSEVLTKVDAGRSESNETNQEKQSRPDSGLSTDTSSDDSKEE